MDLAALAKVLEQPLQHRLDGGKPWLLNVNIPNLPLEQLKPPRVCRLGRRHSADKAITNYINAVGKGEGSPVTQAADCPDKQSRATLITCLQPDRRVEVEVSGTR